MAVMHFDLFSFKAHVSCLREMKTRYTPASIHTEVAWSSLNNNICEDTSKMIYYSETYYSLFSFLSDQTGGMLGHTLFLV